MGQDARMDAASATSRVTVERHVWSEGTWRRGRYYLAYVVRCNGTRIDSFLRFSNAIRKARQHGKWSYIR